MANGSTALVVPLLTPFVAISINSVRDRDSTSYRLIVGFWGLVAGALILVKVFFNVGLVGMSSFFRNVLVLITHVVVLALLAISSGKEVTWGLNSRNRERFMTEFLHWVEIVIVAAGFLISILYLYSAVIFPFR